MKVPFFLSIGLLVAVALQPKGAAACGGCFHETIVSSSADTLVTGHRMAFAISKNRTVLWDQIKFSGSPNEFGWVLPVKHGATIEPSTDAWFEALETVTKVQVASPQVTCPPPAGGFSGGSGDGCNCGFGSSKDAMSASGQTTFNGGGFVPPPPPVTVVHQGTVGAFQTVTLSSTDGSALRTWLSDHGYAVPPDIEPVIDTYVSEGAEFIALRLIPGKDVNEMTPVRVVTPGGDPILPLRMVAAGTGMFVDIVLYVIGEGRYGLEDLTESQVDLSLLNYDFTKDDSNYSKLRTDALNQNKGFSYVTAFAARGAMFTPVVDGNGIQTTFTDTASNPYMDFASLYFGQADVNEDRVPEYSCAQGVLNRLGGNVAVTANPFGDAGPPKLPSDAGTLRDAGARADAGKTITGPIAADYVCDGHSDIAAAMIGMHPNQVWVARLEMNLPREALSMDCNVGLASTQGDVSNQLKANKATNLPCAGGVITGGVAQSFANSTSTCVSAIASLLAIVVARRQQRRPLLRFRSRRPS